MNVFRLTALILLRCLRIGATENVQGNVVPEENTTLSLRGAKNRVRVVQQEGRLIVQVEGHSGSTQMLPGTMLWVAPRSLSGLVVENLIGDGGKEIICLPTDGASLGAYLRVFQYIDGRLRSIAPKDAGGYKFDIVPLGKGKAIVTYGRWEDPKSATAEALVWDGHGSLLMIKRTAGPGTTATSWNLQWHMSAIRKKRKAHV